MTARLKTRHTLYSVERKLASLPSDPVLDFSPLFPSFFLLFPDDNELADLLFAFSFKEMFRLTGCEVDPGAAPSCSNSRSTKTTQKTKRLVSPWYDVQRTFCHGFTSIFPDTNRDNVQIILLKLFFLITLAYVLRELYVNKGIIVYYTNKSYSKSTKIQGIYAKNTDTEH